MDLIFDAVLERGVSFQLRQFLIIPVSQNIVLERYSDSVDAYMILDNNNPSVYKQL